VKIRFSRSAQVIAMDGMYAGFAGAKTGHRRMTLNWRLLLLAIRPFVIGRKNWLFSASVKGVEASANLYSLIETAKANGLEPYAYLRYLFTELPKAETVQAIEALLPGNIDKDQIRIG
jgi:hypothetical protein